MAIVVLFKIVVRSYIILLLDCLNFFALHTLYNFFFYFLILIFRKENTKVGVIVHISTVFHIYSEHCTNINFLAFYSLQAIFISNIFLMQF